MIGLRFLTALLVAMAILGFAFHIYSATDVAFKLARIEAKKLVYVFEMKTCGYCKLFNARTLSDPSVRKVLDINYRVVIIYFSENPEMFRRFGVRGTPTIWFFDATEKGPRPITYLPGYAPPGIFVKVLKYVYRLPKIPFKEYIKKEDPFMGEKKLLRVTEEEAEYVLKHDKDSIYAEDMEDFRGEEYVYVTRNEDLAEKLLKKAYRVLLVGGEN